MEQTASVAGVPASGGRRDSYEHLAPLFAEYRDLPVEDPGREALREQLITGYRPVARHIARRHAFHREQIEDLEQVAALGLILAVDRFDPDRGVDFLSYAVPTIAGEVLRHFRDRSTTIRVPRPLQQLQRRIHTAAAELGQRLGRSPRPSELAAALDVDLATVLEGLAAIEARSHLSFDEPSGADDGVPSDRLRLEAALGQLEPELELVEQRESLRPLLRELPDRERRILLLRFFRGQTQSEIGRQLGISQMHVSRLLSRTLVALRQRLATEGDGQLPESPGPVG